MAENYHCSEFHSIVSRVKHKPIALLALLEETKCRPNSDTLISTDILNNDNNKYNILGYSRHCHHNAPQIYIMV